MHHAPAWPWFLEWLFQIPGSPCGILTVLLGKPLSFFFFFCNTANTFSVKSTILFVILISSFSSSFYLSVLSFLTCSLLSDASLKNLLTFYAVSIVPGLFLFSLVFLSYFSSPRWTQWGQLFHLFQSRKYSLWVYKVSRKWGGAL